MSIIPNQFHFIWVGDEQQEPSGIIHTWKALNPEAKVHIYRNDDLFHKDWLFKPTMLKFYERGEYCGVADLMRWELLYKKGGFAIDADLYCLQKLPRWLYDCSLCACWDSSQQEGKLLINSFVGAPKNSIAIKGLIDYLLEKGIRLKRKRFSFSKMKFKNYPAWRSVGPKPFTQIILNNHGNLLTALPSHFFLPMGKHTHDYIGKGPVYAFHLWGSTKGKTPKYSKKFHNEMIKKYA